MLSARTSRVKHFHTPQTTVWGHVSARAAVKQGTCKAIVCDHCETEFSGGSVRITEHYAKCKSIPTHVREWAVEKLGKSAAKREGKEAVKKMEGMFDDIAKESAQTKITASLNKNTCATELCHEAISHFIYDNLESFNITGVASFIAAIDTIVKFAPDGYKPPTPFLVRGKYLDAAYEKTQKKAKVLFGDMEHMCALTIMSDGKTNNAKVPIVNYIAKSPKGAHFLAAVDMGLAEKDNKKMAQYLHEKCVETGFEKSFYLCVLDGALRSAFPYVIEKMPWISCIWCSCHILSLFFKDCFSGDKGLPLLKEALEKVKSVVRFVRDRQKPLAFFGEVSKKALILPGTVVIYTHLLHVLTLDCSQVTLDLPPLFSPSTASSLASTASTPCSRRRSTRSGYVRRTAPRKSSLLRHARW